MNSSRPALPFPIQRPRALPQLRTPVPGNNGMYTHMAMMLPALYDRYAAYLRQTRRRTAINLLFRPHESVEIIFRPIPGQAPIVYEMSRSSLVETLTSEYGIPGDQAGSLTIEMGIPSDDLEGFRVLGGNSVIQLSFTSLNALNYNDILELLNERGYSNVAIDLLHFTFRFAVLDLLQRASGGRCPNFYDQCLPPWLPALADYEQWTPGQKIAFGKVYIESAPSHLKKVRGLWFLSDQHTEQRWIEPVCGIMAFEYGYQDALYRQGKPNRCVEYYRYPERLYQRALEYESEFGIKGPIVNAAFHYLIDIYLPEYAVFVYDYRLMPLYHYQGRLYIDHAQAPYKKGALTREEWTLNMQYRIHVFLDLEKQHYFPIFNLRLFFNPYRLPSQQLKRTRDRKEKPVGGLRADNVRLPCPHCHHRVRHNLETHECSGFRCIYCEQHFFNKRSYDVHMKKQGEWCCDYCEQDIPNQTCYTKHRSICAGVCFERCHYCHKYFRVTQPHICQKYKCDRCGYIVLDPLSFDEDNNYHPYRKLHRCPLKGAQVTAEVTALDNVQRSMKYFAFDFECMLQTEHDVTMMTLNHVTGNRTPIYRHIVNYAYAMEISETGQEDDPLEVEAFTIDAFWQAMCKMSDKVSTVWYAHNLKGYDGRLILDFLEAQQISPKSLFQRGDKVLMMVVKNPFNGGKTQLTFKDSLLHIAAPLSSLPKMFGLDEDMMEKGMFPYLFNTPENQDYHGPMPDQLYFEPQYMSAEQKSKFNRWYSRKARSRYNLKRELIKYCKNDVLILQRGLLAYTKVCLKYGHRDPLQDMTIAQYTFNVYRERHMPNDTLFYLDHCQVNFARRALHGGKTDTRCMLYHQTAEEARKGCGLRYVDIQSLYPTVQYYDPMPTGQPVTLRYSAEHQPDERLLMTFFGFIECDIRPTRYLHHPLLCDYQDKKLLAHLYPMKRVVLTSAEFQVAVREAAYHCTHVYRIDFYKPRYDLFRSFIREWLRLKIVSGAQPYKEDEAAFEEYQSELSRRLEIQVQKEDFQFNPSLRTLAKLVLNSLWGKFGQRDQLVKCDILTDSAEMIKYHERKRNGLIEEKATREYGGFMHMKKYVNVHGISNKNVAIAAFVTAHARIRLWRQLHRLWDRVYYHDTDSIIYYYDPNDAEAYNIPEGNFLGDWESETGKAVITDLVALAPKTYAYRYRDDKGKIKEIVKAKGFHVKGDECERLFTLDEYEKLLRQNVTEIAVQQRIFRHVVFPEPAMQTYDAIKKMVFQYNKGVVDQKSFRTYPFGYEQFLAPGLISPMFDQSELMKHWQPDQRLSVSEMERHFITVESEETYHEQAACQQQTRLLQQKGPFPALESLIDWSLERAAECERGTCALYPSLIKLAEEETQNNREIIEAVLYHAQREHARNTAVSEEEVVSQFFERRGDISSD